MVNTIPLERQLYRIIKQFLDKNYKKKLSLDKAEARRADAIVKLVDHSHTTNFAGELTTKKIYQVISLIDLYTSETTTYHNARQVKALIKKHLVR